MDQKTSPLTGRDATEAISLAMRLGAADARFDARRVSRDIASRVGRARLSGALLMARFVVWPRSSTSGSGSRRSVARRSRLRGSTAAASPGRPGLPGEGA